jgi:hypothetical protein
MAMATQECSDNGVFSTPIKMFEDSLACEGCMSSVISKDVLGFLRNDNCRAQELSTLVRSVEILESNSSLDAKQLRELFAAGKTEEHQFKRVWSKTIMDNTRRYVSGPEGITGIIMNDIEGIPTNELPADLEEYANQTPNQLYRNKKWNQAHIEHSDPGVSFWLKAGYTILLSDYKWWYVNEVDLVALYNEINNHVDIDNDDRYLTEKTNTVVGMFKMLYDANMNRTGINEDEYLQKYPPLEILMIMIEFYTAWPSPNKLKNDAGFTHDARPETVREHGNHLVTYVHLLVDMMIHYSTESSRWKVNDALAERLPDLTAKPLHEKSFGGVGLDARMEARFTVRYWTSKFGNLSDAANKTKLIRSLHLNMLWRYRMIDVIRGALLSQRVDRNNELGFRNAGDDNWYDICIKTYKEMKSVEDINKTAEANILYSNRLTLSQIDIANNWRMLNEHRNRGSSQGLVNDFNADRSSSTSGRQRSNSRGRKKGTSVQGTSVQEEVNSYVGDKTSPVSFTDKAKAGLNSSISSITSIISPSNRGNANYEYHAVHPEETNTSRRRNNSREPRRNNRGQDLGADLNDEAAQEDTWGKCCSKIMGKISNCTICGGGRSGGRKTMRNSFCKYKSHKRTCRVRKARRARKSKRKSKRTRRVRKSSKSSRKAKTRRRVKK